MTFVILKILIGISFVLKKSCEVLFDPCCQDKMCWNLRLCNRIYILMFNSFTTDICGLSSIPVLT